MMDGPQSLAMSPTDGTAEEIVIEDIDLEITSRYFWFPNSNDSIPGFINLPS